MKGFTHLAFTALLSTILLKLGIPWYTLGVFWLGSLFPDFDLFFKHRKLLHNVFVLLPIVFPNIYFFLFGLGVLSHFFLDSLTVSGIMPFWPFSYKRYGLRLIRSGSLADHAIGVASILLAAILFLK